jgi:hypothetical protein
VKDDLNGLDKAVSAVLGQRTIERNQLLVSIAKSKLTRRRDDKNEKITKPEELVRLYDLLLQVKYLYNFFLHDFLLVKCTTEVARCEPQIY